MDNENVAKVKQCTHPNIRVILQGEDAQWAGIWCPDCKREWRPLDIRQFIIFSEWVTIMVQQIQEGSTPAGIMPKGSDNARLQ